MPADGVRVGAFIAAVFAANALLTAFLPLYLADRGLSAATIGTVLGVASLVRVAGVPASGWLADRTGAHRGAMVFGAACAALCAAALAGASAAPLMGVLVSVGGVAASVVSPLSDALALALAARGRLDYGRTRAWGSVAYMAATVAGGAAAGRFGTGIVPAALALFYAAGAGLGLLLPRTRTPPHAAAAGPLGRSFRAVLLATALVQGSHAAYYGFASLTWRAAGIPDVVIGALIAEGIVAEVALFVWGRRLVERLGPARLTSIAAAGAALRWTATAFTTAVPALAAIQLLHATSFACQHMANMLVLRGLPPGRAGTAQALLSAFGFSAPVGLGIWLCGALYAQAGGRIFLLMAALAAPALLVTRWLPGGTPRRSA